MNKETKRYLKFEDAALQSSFLEQLRRSGIAYELNRSGAVAFAEENANTIISAAFAKAKEAGMKPLACVVAPPPEKVMVGGVT